LLCLLSLSVCAADTNDFPIVKLNGQTLTNAYIAHFDAVYVWIWQRVGGGGGKFKLSEMPPEIQQRCHYDPAAEALVLAQAAENANAVASAQAQRKIEQAFDSFISGHSNDVIGTVSWSTKQNFLILATHAPPGIPTGLDAVAQGFDSAAYSKEHPNQLPLGIGGLGIGFHAATGSFRTVPPNVTLDFNFVSVASWERFSQRDFAIAWDTSRTNLARLPEISESDLEDMGIWAFGAAVSFEDFKAVAFAKSVKAQFGELHFEFPYQNREPMRAFVNYFDLKVQPATNVPPATPPAKR